jgi:hypothetical protein
MLYRELGEMDANTAIEKAAREIEKKEAQRDEAMWKHRVASFAGLDTYTAAEFAEAEKNYRAWIAEQ